MDLEVYPPTTQRDFVLTTEVFTNATPAVKWLMKEVLVPGT